MNIGDLDITYLAIGDTHALSACVGTEVVWSASGSPTPGPVYSAMPLTFEILSAGTIVLTAYNTSGIGDKEISYSINDGPWVSITATTSPGTSFNVSAGDIVRFKGNNTGYGDIQGNNNFGSSTAVFNIYGNIMSLIYDDNFLGQTSFPNGSSYNFSNMFRGCTGIISAENLVLPAMQLAEGCYQYFFYTCTNLTTGPELPATEPADRCYLRFYGGCTSLSYIKCMLHNLNYIQYYPTENWVYGVNGTVATGTFVCYNVQSTGWSLAADDGIPDGWTVVDAE